MALPDMTSPSSNRPVGRKSRSAHGNGYVLSRDLTPQLVPLAGCKALGRESHTHPPRQVRKLAASLERFGFVLPILIDAECRVVAGWGLVLAARQLGLSEVPAVKLTDLLSEHALPARPQAMEIETAQMRDLVAQRQPGCALCKRSCLPHRSTLPLTPCDQKSGRRAHSRRLPTQD